MNASDTLGDRIQNAMRVRGDISQADLARATGLSTALIAQIINGTTKDPRFSNIVKIARTLDVPLEYLAGGIKSK